MKCHIGSCQRHQKCMYVPCRAPGAFDDLLPWKGPFLTDIQVGDTIVLEGFVAHSGVFTVVAPRVDDPCDVWPYAHHRPTAPVGEDALWYRGWEASYDGQGAYAAVFGDERWVAYKGGCDLDAPEVSLATWAGLLNEIDEAEDD